MRARAGSAEHSVLLRWSRVWLYACMYKLAAYLQADVPFRSIFMRGSSRSEWLLSYLCSNRSPRNNGRGKGQWAYTTHCFRSGPRKHRNIQHKCGQTVIPISIDRENRTLSHAGESVHNRSDIDVGGQWTVLGEAVPSCATPVQVGSDTQTLKEPVARWHRAARSHLYCRDTIVVLVPHSADSVASFVAPGIAPLVCLASPAFSAILLRPHVTTDKTNKKRENRYFLLSVLSPPVLHSPFLLPHLRHTVLQSTE